MPSAILQKFQQEVLSSSPEATLPCNLNDYWLSELQEHLEECFRVLSQGCDDEENEAMSLPLAAIVHILFAKNAGAINEMPLEDLFRHFEDYRLELALEQVRRKTDVKAEPATLATIFTNRDVTFQH
ncbi:hypothetical protein [Pseudomonas sp. PDM19]|uniref:hypothetical protein n=1 Tax=Pseudomonas sp. PDM19 TaxID=2769272 RepID=UPI0017860435|nr:hypothetical protein [Pseudomonas sp. PDM19]MBD9634615.1 hypothetical protein [Pseudomonas sp. PDM19]